MVEWFTPGYKAGGPIRSCVNICAALKNECDIYVLTTDTDHGESKPYEGIKANTWISDTNLGVQVYYAQKSLSGMRSLAKVMLAVNADYVYLNLLFSPSFVLYPLWLKYIRRLPAQTILCPRGTLYDSAIALKAYKKKPFLQLIKWLGIHRQITFHATNEREAKAIDGYFPGSKIITADNLPNILQQAFVSCVKKEGSIRCIFIARIVPIKNLLYLLKLLAGVSSKVLLTIVGPAENEDYWLECKKEINQLPLQIEVAYLGPQQNEALPALIQQHHLFILPTTGENFGHAIFEALVAGRPALISDQTPWLNLSEYNAGLVLPLNQPEAFATFIDTFAAFNQHQFDGTAMAAWQYASQFIQNPLLKKQYLQLFD